MAIHSSIVGPAARSVIERSAAFQKVGGGWAVRFGICAEADSEGCTDSSASFQKLRAEVVGVRVVVCRRVESDAVIWLWGGERSE